MKTANIIDGGRTGKGMPLGYDLPVSVKPLLREWCKTSLWMSCAIALGDHATLLLCGLLGQTVGGIFGWWSWLPIHLLILWPLCGRALRGLENLTHEASHQNFDRSSRVRNNRAADWFCAWWVFLSVHSFWQTHRRHHGEFATGNDPDKRRLTQLEGWNLPRQNPGQFALRLLQGMPHYIAAYWAQFTESPGRLAVSLSIHSGLLLGGQLLISENFSTWWITYFLIPFLVYLPVIRFLAESEEHHYGGASTVLEATYSNLGMFQRWGLHPHGDAYHLLHHLLPTIPHWNMRKTHASLFMSDPSYRKSKIRNSIFSVT